MMVYCSADGCYRTEPCGFNCRDNGNFDKACVEKGDMYCNHPLGQECETEKLLYDTGKESGKEPTVSIKFTRTELWELMNGFSASFLEGEEGNELATAVSAKLGNAYDKIKEKVDDG